MGLTGNLVLAENVERRALQRIRVEILLVVAGPLVRENLSLGTLSGPIGTGVY